MQPGGQVLYLGQLSEEVLVQRLGLFSYWKAAPMSDSLRRDLRASLNGLDQKLVEDKLLLIR